MTGKKRHPGHKTRMSDSSLYDEVCVYCGATDGRSDDGLFQPCPGPQGGRQKMDPVGIIKRAKAETIMTLPANHHLTNVLGPLFELLEWKPIETAPIDERVLISGRSGYVEPNDWYVRTGRLRAKGDKFGGRWVDDTGECITDGAEDPIAWTRLFFKKPERLNPSLSGDPKIDELLRKAKTMTPKELWVQRRSFAEGNFALSHPEMDRKKIKAIFDEIDPEPDL